MTVVLALTAVQAADPTSARGVASYVAIAMGASAAILHGVRRHRPAVKIPWYLTAAAPLLGCIGMVLRLRLAGQQGTVTSIVPDLVTIPAYLLLMVGLIGFLRARRGAEAGTAIDAGLMGIAALLMSWAVLVQPVLSDAAMPTVMKVVNATYPTISAAVLFLVALLAMTEVWTLRAFWLLSLAWVSLITGDVIYALASAGAPTLPLWVANSAYCIFYALLGTAGLHPSMAALSRPAVHRVRGYGRSRLAAVAIALLVPAAVIALHPSATLRERLVSAGLVCLLDILVLVRTAGAVNRHVTSQIRLELLESAPNGMLLVDADGSIRAANPEAERLFGYAPGELVGRPVEVLLPERFHRAHPGLREAFLDEPRTRPMGHGRDLSGRRKDGSEFPVEVGLAVAPGSRDMVTCVVADVSQRKCVEEERARLLASERRARERLARLQQISDAGLARLPMEELLHDLIERVAEAVGGDVAAVLLLDEERTHVVQTASRGLNDMPLEELVPVGAVSPGSAARTVRRIDVDDLTDAEVYRRGLVHAGVTSVAVAPLVVEGVVIGVLHVGSRDPSGGGEDDAELLQALADRVALAVDRARSFERERNIAETLQRSLLPSRLPLLAGATVAARYYPGATGMRVGGDWYDVLELPDRDVLLVVGDVMGRGVRAATVMGHLRTALRVYLELGLTLPEIVSRLNHTVLGIGESEMATLLLVAVTPGSGDVQVVSAGHLPPVVRHPDGASGLLEGASGIALGVTPAATYDVARTTLQPGAGILLYTDGLVERPGAALSAGLEALQRAVAEVPGAPELACDALVARFLPTGPPGDDVALLWMSLDETSVPTLDLPLPGSVDDLPRVRAALRSWLHEAEAGDADAPHAGTDGGRGFELVEATAADVGGHHDADVPFESVVPRPAPTVSGRLDDREDDGGLTVPAEPESVPACRRYVRERLAGAPPKLIDNAELSVSELVTNAVLHAGPEIEVRVSWTGDCVRLEVRDTALALPRRRCHTKGATTGRGLEMVAGVSRAWGIRPLDGGGKAVWCDVTYEAAAGSAEGEHSLARWAELEIPTADGDAGRDDDPVPYPRGTSEGAASERRAELNEDGGRNGSLGIVLRRYPVHLAAHARDHVESLVRECLLTGEAAKRRPTAPARQLVALAETLFGYRCTLDAVEPRPASSPLAGQGCVDAVLPPIDGVERARAWRDALAELNRHAERGELLTLPMPPDVAAVHRWVLDEIAAQSHGCRPRAWNGRADKRADLSQAVV